MSLSENLLIQISDLMRMALVHRVELKYEETTTEKQKLTIIAYRRRNDVVRGAKREEDRVVSLESKETLTITDDYVENEVKNGKNINSS